MRKVCLSRHRGFGVRSYASAPKCRPLATSVAPCGDYGLERRFRLKAEATVLIRPVATYARMNASTSSRLRSISSGVVASRFSRSIGSVFDARTLKCQSANSADTPSS